MFSSKKAKEARRIQHVDLKMAILDLRHMVTELGVKDAASLAEASRRDEFDTLKAALMNKLQTIRDHVTAVVDLRKSGGIRSAQEIKLTHENEEQLKVARNDWHNLHVQLKKDQSKKKLGEELLADRIRIVELMGKEIQNLVGQNGRVKVAPTTGLQQQLEDRRAARKERRTEKQQHKKGGGAVADALEAIPLSPQEEAFMKQVEANQAVEDQLLDDISVGLDELKSLAEDMNKSLKLQKVILAEVEEKMDNNIAMMKNANSRMKEIFEEAGGTSRWCSLLVCGILLLALVGFLIQIAVNFK